MVSTPPRDHRWTWMWWTRHPFPGCTVARERESLREKKSNKSKIFKNPFCQVLVTNTMYVCTCVDEYTWNIVVTHTQLRSDARRARLTKKKRNDKSNDRSHTRGNAERREMHMSFRVFGFALGQVRQSPILHDDWRKYKSQIWTLLLRMARKGKRDKKNTKS